MNFLKKLINKIMDYWQLLLLYIRKFFAEWNKRPDTKELTTKSSMVNKYGKTDEDFITDSKAALLTKTTPLANGILYTLAAFLIVGLIWAYFAPIDEITVGEGKVIPSTQVKVIQSLDGGIILSIPVTEGQEVKKGQVLVVIDNTRYKADYDAQLDKYYALLAMVSRLTAEAQNQDIITFPNELQQGHMDLITRETELFQERKNALAKELAVLQQSYDYAQKELAIYRPMVQKGIVPQIEYLRSERTANDIESRMLAQKNKFSEDALTELNQRKADLAATKDQLISLRDKMTHATITSPVYGIVKKIYIITIGGVIQPGVPIMDVVPLEDTLLVQAHIKPSDIAFIHPGQQATVKITAYDYSIYGSLSGVVEYVSADAIEPPKAEGVPDKNVTNYYLVNIRTQKNYLGTEKHKLPIIPGMNATVHIMTGKKTIMQYILKPLLKAKNEALRER